MLGLIYFLKSKIQKRLSTLYNLAEYDFKIIEVDNKSEDKEKSIKNTKRNIKLKLREFLENLD